MSTTLGNQLDALSHEPQRRLLAKLARNNPRDDTPFDGDEPVVEEEDVEILLDFQHYHIPELEDKGFVDYDREANVVTRGPHFEEIAPLLRLINDHRDELPDDWL